MSFASCSRESGKLSWIVISSLHVEEPLGILIYIHSFFVIYLIKIRTYNEKTVLGIPKTLINKYKNSHAPKLG
jgi:hypothetical protein